MIQVLSVRTSTGKRPSVEVGSMPREPRYSRSLQLGVFRLGLLENRDVGVSVFPEREETIVRTFRLVAVSR